MRLPPAKKEIFKDKEGAAFTGVGDILGHLWQPFCRVRPGKHGSAVLRLQDFAHTAPAGANAEAHWAALSKATLLGDLGNLAERLRKMQGGLGPGIGEIQCVLGKEGKRGALYISGGFAANEKNFDALQIKGVVRLGGYTYAVKEGIDVHSVNIGDNKLEELTPHIEGIVRFQEEHLRSGQNVLVHCGAGVSRSGAAVVGFLMWKNRMCYGKALELVRKRREWVRPNDGFAAQLQEYPFQRPI